MSDTPESVEITTVEIDGRQVEAHKLICESCNTLWLDVEVDTTDSVVWKAYCPHCANVWEFCP